MAGLIENFMQGYVNRVNSSMNRNGESNDALSAQTTSDAYQRLQQAIQSDYNQQKALAEKNGQQWQMPGPSERFNDQVQAMIISGDPNLQKRGLALLDAPKEEATTTLEKTANLLGLTPMQVFQMQHPGPANTRINVNLPKMDQPISLEDLQKLQLPNGQPVPLGASMRDAGQMGATIAQTKAQGESGAAGEVSAKAIVNLGDNLVPTTTPGQTALETARTMPGLIGQVTSAAAGAMGIPPNPKAVKFQQARSQAAAQTLKLLSGASATDQEFERIMSLYPNMTDDPQTQRIKYNQMLEQTQAIVDRARSQGVTNLPDLSKVPRQPETRVQRTAPNAPQAPKAPEAPQAPQTHTSKSGITFTVK